MDISPQTHAAPTAPQEASAPVPPATVSAAPKDELDRLRFWIAVVIFVAFPILLALTVTAAIFLAVVISNKTLGDTIERMALASSIQVAFGMVMGFISLFVGVMMTWFGITADYSLAGKLGATGLKSGISLKSASPGLIFAVGGILLIGVCLYKPLVYEEKGGVPLGRNFGKGLPSPEPPPKPE